MLRILVAALGLSLAVTSLADEPKKAEAKKEAKKTFEGTIVDVKCTVFKAGDLQCWKDCLKSGLPAGLQVGKQLYVLAADPKPLAEYVGQKAKVEGDAKDNILVPSSTFKITGADGKQVEVGSGGH